MHTLFPPRLINNNLKEKYMKKDRKSIHISAEAHEAMLHELKLMQKKAQKAAEYKVNPPNIEEWVSEAIFERIKWDSQK